jgi:hypothetical protein
MSYDYHEFEVAIRERLELNPILTGKVRVISSKADLNWGFEESGRILITYAGMGEPYEGSREDTREKPMLGSGKVVQPMDTFFELYGVINDYSIGPNDLVASASLHKILKASRDKLIGFRPPVGTYIQRPLFFGGETYGEIEEKEDVLIWQQIWRMITWVWEGE